MEAPRTQKLLPLAGRSSPIGPGLDAFADPLRCSAVVRNDERFHRESKVRRPSVCRAQELLDLFLAAVKLICRDIFVGRIVSENRVDLLQLVERPGGVKLVAPAGEFPREKSRHSLRSAHLKADLELRCITVAILGQRWDQLLSAAAEDEICIIGRAAPSLAVVRGQLVNLIRGGFIKVKLRIEFLGAP